MRRSEPMVDQAGYHIDSEPMGEQRRPGAAAQACGGKYYERPALLRAEVTFSRRHSDCVRHRRNRGKSPPVRAGASQYG
jgi:hypothetical protein